MNKIVMLARFRKKRLTQARHLRLWTMTELADRVNLTRQAISSFEKGDSDPSPNTLRKLSNHLGVTTAFLTLPVTDTETKLDSVVNFRTLAASTLKSRQQAESYLQIVGGLTDFLSEKIQFPTVNLPDFVIDDFYHLTDDEVEELAEQTRRHFGLGDGPISDLTLLLENNGVVVSYLPIESGMDGLSAWYNGKPFTLINKSAYAARARFDLAHELGHLVMHKSVTSEDLAHKSTFKKIEHDAHRFASAFLMPEASFVPEVYGFDFDSLKVLKERWGTSFQAIIMRLYSVQMITESQKKRFFQNLSAKGMRKKEPLDGQTKREQPLLLTRVVEFLDMHKIIPLAEFLESSKFPASIILDLIDMPEEVFTSKTENNIINFQART